MIFKQNILQYVTETKSMILVTQVVSVSIGHSGTNISEHKN